MKTRIGLAAIALSLTFGGLPAPAQDAAGPGLSAPDTVVNTGDLGGQFVIVPDAERSDTITLQYVPDLADVPPPPDTGDIALRARRTTYSEPAGVQVFNTVYACRTCQNWKSVRHCADPSKPGTCRNVWVPDGNATSQCGTAPAWMVATDIN
ncbi:MAG: hypothetical protein QNJ13_12600 [Paracoccaceae bacterium]|nr:hypothetical protein [Paracoccaceae bacterium]